MVYNSNSTESITVTHKALSLPNAKNVSLDLTFKLRPYDSPLGQETAINILKTIGSYQLFSQFFFCFVAEEFIKYSTLG